MLSVCNNKMLLDMMLNNKKYIKYMTERNSENSKTRNKKNIHLKKIGINIIMKLLMIIIFKNLSILMKVKL